VLAGIGLDDASALAMDSTPQAFGDEAWHRGQQPAYSRYTFNLGEISSYPLVQENAGIFCHVNRGS